MWIRVRLIDVRIVLHFTGIFLIGLSVAMLLPLATAIAFREWGPALDYILGIGVCIAVGGALRFAIRHEARVTHTHALALTATGWAVAALVGAIPLALSPHYPQYVDAVFDVMSGLTTSGLTVAVDLDHMAVAHNMWRHLTHFIGGQGIVVAALSLAVGMRGAAFSLYSAEGRDERVLPNVLHTTRFIWAVATVYVGLGTLALFAVNTYLGMSVVRGAIHAFWLSIAAYDTGGFAPQSQNAMYYHSYLFEVVLLFLMLAGTLNFNLHAQVWRGDRAELWRNIETRVLAGNILILSAIVAFGMGALAGTPGIPEVLRKGVFHIVSAHSGTGHQTVYPVQWIRDLGGGTFVAVILAMAAGGAVSSTAGGIKALRIGLILKSVVQHVKSAVSPRSAVTQVRYHHLREVILSPETAAAASLVFIMYTVTYITGGLIGSAYGYGAAEALFESVSATANVGLSTGITSAAMPFGLKLLYIVQMWAGRLEFLAVLVVIAQLVMAVRGLVERRRA